MGNPMPIRHNAKFGRALAKRSSALLLAWLCAIPGFGQPAEFTYQGRLGAAGAPANGSYDLEFRLYDLESGGTLLDTRVRAGVPVASGLFTVSLDFPVSSFPGAARF